MLDAVYSDDQTERLMEVMRSGPWPTIAAQHFDSFEELVATTAGLMPDGLDLTLDDIASPQFRGFLAQSSVCFHPHLYDCFYSPKFLEIAKSYWSAPYAKPTMMLFNIAGPAPAMGPAPAHLDAVTFRGVRFENAPIWLQNVMGKSGLFTDYVVKMAQVISWWYTGENGTFTYWPDGPHGQPKVLEHPLWNRGLVVQNELMFHRGDPVGAFDSPPVNMKNRSEVGYVRDEDIWEITTDGERVHAYQPDQMRFLVHWNAEVYEDMAEMKKVMDHTDDLDIEEAIGRLIVDARHRGARIEEPSDPLTDRAFMKALLETYTIAPTTEWLEVPAA